MGSLTKDQTIMIATSLNQWLDHLRSLDLGYLIDPPYSYLWFAAVGLLALYLLWRLRPPSKIRAFRGDTGYVMVSRHALLELVYSACEQLPEVRKPSVRIRSKRKLHLQVRIQVDGSSRLRDTSSYLQTHLKDALENNMGIERLGSIEVVVTGIRTSPKNRPDLNERSDRRTTSPSSPELDVQDEITVKKPDLNAPLDERPKNTEAPKQPSVAADLPRKDPAKDPSKK